MKSKKNSLLCSLLILLYYTSLIFGAETPDFKPVWITGDVLITDTQQLVFRTDKPVKDNPAGNIVLLGVTKNGINWMLPALSKIADMHLKVRLYGVLQNVDVPTGSPPSFPNVQFIIWKMHLPSEADELPVSKKLQLDPQQKFPGYSVTTNTPSR
jgi:hypothetical protein